MKNDKKIKIGSYWRVKYGKYSGVVKVRKKHKHQEPYGESYICQISEEAHLTKYRKNIFAVKDFVAESSEKQFLIEAIATMLFNLNFLNKKIGLINE